MKLLQILKILNEPLKIRTMFMLCFESQAHYQGLGQNDDTAADSLPLNAVFRQLIVELFIQNIDQMLAQT